MGDELRELRLVMQSVQPTWAVSLPLASSACMCGASNSLLLSPCTVVSLVSS